MGAPELLDHLRDAGLVLTLRADGGLQVAPRSALTDDPRAAIRADRDALVQTLLAEYSKAPSKSSGASPLRDNDQRVERLADGPHTSDIGTPAGRNARHAVPRPTTDDEQVPSQRRRAHVGMSDVQREVAGRYYAHHFACRTCIAAGRDWIQGRRCAVGLALWTAYLACD